jgi:hypothetical protein
VPGNASGGPRDVVSVATNPVVTSMVDGFDTDDLARLARVALIVAAQRRTTLTARELGHAIGVDDVELRLALHDVLTRLAEECAAERMPSLPALVINTPAGAAGHQWPSCDAAWFAETQRVFRAWGG